MSVPRTGILLFASILALAGCKKEQSASGNLANDAAANAADGSDQAKPRMAPLVELIDTTGTGVGRIEASEDAKGVTLKLTIFRLPTGVHGVHLHETGSCDTNGFFKTAGAHWNPAGRKHGRDNPQGAHLGDLANIDVKAGGDSTATVELAGISYSDGEHPLADADGTSLVIHAKRDDYRTDPSGDSGDRIACAVLAPPQTK